MRILLVTEYSPYKTNSGASQRTHWLWRALSELGTVDVLLLSPGTATESSPSDEGFTCAATYRVWPLGLRKYAPDQLLAAKLQEKLDLATYDLICGRYLGPISKLCIPQGTPTIVDLDDIGYVYAASAGPFGRLGARTKSLVRAILEHREFRRYSRFWFVSQRDRQRLRHLLGGVLPNIPLFPDNVPDFDSPDGCILFVGALWYGPNREGVERFLAKCWPAIRHAEPDARLHLVGGAPKADRNRWSSCHGVHASGFVDCLADVYQQAAFTIAPIYSGGGTNIKVLEAFAYGRTCVTTPHTIKAFSPDLTGTEDALSAHDDQEMIAACLRLLRSSPLRATLARRGHEIIQRRFSYEIFRESVLQQIKCLPIRSG